MPVAHAIWKVGDPPIPLSPGRLVSEQQLEAMIISDPGIISSEWMLIGQQEVTSYGGRIDLLAIAPDGSLVLVELKRGRTPRELVAQALDYASWVENLEAAKIAQIYRRFSNGGTLDDAFKERFGAELDEEALNQSHQIIVVAAELDDSTERIIGYLNARDLAINVVLFRVFEFGDELLLSRAWLIDPGETQVNVARTTRKQGPKEPWNGEYYVSFGDAISRDWDDARKYGYVSAGGGRWYSRTLSILSPGDRVWVLIPGTGYVGVGEVTEAVSALEDFNVPTAEGDKPCLEVLKKAEFYKTRADDPENAEYFVRVRWLDTVDRDHAVNEVGLFGNQNTVCQPTTPKWRHTVERLKEHFPKWDG